MLRAAGGHVFKENTVNIVIVIVTDKSDVSIGAGHGYEVSDSVLDAIQALAGSPVVEILHRDNHQPVLLPLIDVEGEQS